MTPDIKFPNAEIISIGEELLIGQTINTNAAWMATQMNNIGIAVHHIVVITDDQEEIERSLELALSRADIVLITGGLGPTRDDVTKNALCNYFDSKLRMDETVLEDITGFFNNRGLRMIELNELQAMVPEKATVIRNPYGTAPGLWFAQGGKVVVAMPGVPFEMQHMVNSYVIPELEKWPRRRHILHKTILTTGIGESFLARKIAAWEDQLPRHIKLAYLPSPGIVKLRLTCTGEDRVLIEEAISEEVRKLLKIIPKYIWGFDEEKLEQKAGHALKLHKLTLATAESCTGGYLAHRITSVPGSSSYFKGSVIAYDNQVKTQVLSVEKTLIDQYGAVSQEVVEQMALNVRKLMKTDLGIALSGIAGPEGGTEDKPAGTVWIAVSGPEETISQRFSFGDNRERNIIRASVSALGMLLKIINNG